MIGPVSKSIMSGMRVGEFGVGRDFQRGINRIARRCAESGGEEHHGHARAAERGGGLDVVARRADEREAGLGDGLGIVEHVRHRRGAAFLRRAGRFDGVGDEAVADVAGRWIGIEAAAAGLRGALVAAHEIEELAGQFRALTQRSHRSCSMPHSSGNSDSAALPPSATSRSAV